MSEILKNKKLFERFFKKSKKLKNNLELRFPNEPARHKRLDVVGDLA